MEKITGSLFGKFEGFSLSNVKGILGGADTGAGEACLGGSCTAYESDKTNADGSTTYYNVHDVKKEC